MAVLAPVLGTAAAAGADAALLDQGRDWHPTTAVLTQDAAADGTAVATGVDAGRSEALVRWTAPDGSVHTAVTQVAPGTRAGSKTVIWTDARGRLQSRPPSLASAQLQGDLAGACVVGGVCLALLGGRHVVVRLTLDRHRAHEWEREWAEVEPHWRSGRP
jgi:hypothetical protein